jgi:streptogramin lyase
VEAGELSTHQIGTVRECAVLSRQTGLIMPAAAPNGHVWVGEMDTNRLAELEPATGQVQKWATPRRDGSASGIAIGADGMVWFVVRNSNAIGLLARTDSGIAEYRLLIARLPLRALGRGGWDCFGSRGQPGVS